MPYIKLAMPERARGSYLRGEYKDDIVLNRKFHYKEIDLTFSRRACKVKDAVSEELVKLGLVSSAQNEDYLREVSSRFTGQGVCNDMYLEEISQEIHRIRKAHFGAEVLESYRKIKMQEGVQFDPRGMIDQRKKKDKLLSARKTIFFALCQPEFFFLLKEDLKKAKACGAQAFLLVSEEKGELLPACESLAALLDEECQCLTVDQKGLMGEASLCLDADDACLLVYGEDGLLNCRDLAVDSFVYANPCGYQGLAVTNMMGNAASVAVFVPRGFDVTRWVRITERSRLTYWHLAKLWEDHGDGIYTLSPEELYRRYPGYFVNIYQNGIRCDHRLIPMESPRDFADFDRLRDVAIEKHLNSTGNVRYYATYFDEDLREKDICRDGTPQSGILVHAVRIKKAKDARVLPCGKDRPLRRMFEELGEKGTGVCSNFLFFLTASLANLYNSLREDRPSEQAEIAAGHIDYMLYFDGKKRVETFPLFRKTCIAKKKNGEFLFFNFRLGGGKLSMNEATLEWTAADVDPVRAASPVCVYTPYLSVSDGDADRSTYRRIVGEDRVNLVILQDRITCIRTGDVVLPGIGVVVSLERDLGEKLLAQWALPALDDGYYDVKGLDFTLCLDAPAEIEPAVWEEVEWSYGGGLSLILDGVALSDSADTDQWFRQEGWMSPLSRQTQESSLHTMVKHPRTAIGTTADGELVILVFSGRTRRSTGADYCEMIQIARTLFPDIRSLMNVDGGGSAMLGMVRDGCFMELSCPSSSTGSIVGMVRPINTVFYLPAGE